jgi:hypothetical protein
MKSPEATDALLASLLAKLMNCKLLNSKGTGKLIHREDMNELITFHDIILFNTTSLGDLFKFD